MSQTIAPLRDPLGRLQLLSVPFFLLVVFLALGVEQVKEEALLQWAALQALIYALPVFIVWNLIIALFGANKKIAEKGQWINNRFVYHTPLHIYTTQFGPSDDGKEQTIKVTDAEPNTFVQFRLDHYGGRGVAGINGYGLLLHQIGISRNTNFGARIGKKREITVVFKCPENSDDTTVRIYVESWGP